MGAVKSPPRNERRGMSLMAPPRKPITESMSGERYQCETPTSTYIAIAVVLAVFASAAVFAYNYTSAPDAGNGSDLQAPS
jgi:hypothetical protein